MDQGISANRSQEVVVENEKSDHVRVTSGVPQGAVLGPILFFIYINDLPEGTKSKIRLFADDTAAYLTVNNLTDTGVLQQDLNKLQQWEVEWDMEFNPGKCTVLQVTRSRAPFPSQYTLHGQVLETVPSAKYLGVNFSKNLSWNNHIQRICNSANRSLGFVKRNIRTKDPGVRELAYKALVRPLVEYASPVWSPYTKTYIDKIEMVQRRAARWTTNNFSCQASVIDMLNTLGWRSLKNRRSDARLCLFYKIIHGLVAVPLPPYVQHPV